jgi:predicted dehydrogenase
MPRRPTRRTFLASTAAAATTVWAGKTAPAVGIARSPGPNETINMGLIGCGGQGRADMRKHLAVPGVNFVAVCDVNQKRLALGARDTDNDSVRTYRDYRRLLDNQDIDAVIIGTNGHWHVLPAVQACQAGKDVYVEKPLGTSIGEGRAVVEAAKKYNRIVQIGTQQRAGIHYQRAAEIIQSGRLGEISEVRVWDYDNFYPGFGSPPDSLPPPEFGEDYWDFWVGPSPKAAYNPNRFAHHYWFFDYGGGWQLDWAVHHYDVVNWCLGVTAPKAVVALGGFKCFEDSNTQWPDTFSATCEYGPGPVARKGFLLHYTSRCGCVHKSTYAASHGKIFCGTEASMVLDRSGYTIHEEPPADRRSQLWSLPQATRVVETLTNNESEDRLLKHAHAFIDAVRNHQEPAASALTGHQGSIPGHLMNIAWKTSRRIQWDGETEQIEDDPEASALVTKQYRAPWKLEI